MKLLPSAGLVNVLLGTHRPSTPGHMSDTWPCFIHPSVFPCTPGQCHPDDGLSKFSGLGRSWYPVFLCPNSSKSSRVPMYILASTRRCLQRQLRLATGLLCFWVDSGYLRLPKWSLSQIVVDHVWPWSHFGLPFLVPRTVKINSCGFEPGLLAISNHDPRKHCGTCRCQAKGQGNW